MKNKIKRAEIEMRSILDYLLWLIVFVLLLGAGIYFLFKRLGA